MGQTLDPSTSTPEGTPAPSRYLSQNSLSSAAVVVSLLQRYVSARSVVDFGCKHGEWLTVFREFGADTLLGFDQEKRAARIILQPHEFRVADLNKPLSVSERFDLAVCIEVAEHLSPAAAATLVGTLTSVAPVVLFSAALPGQGGHGHFNEQPRRYWHELFAGHGFAPVDCLRPQIWQDSRVAFWYRQNLLLYASDEGLQRHPALQTEARQPRASDMELIHVDMLHRLSWGHRLKGFARRAVGTLRRGRTDSSHGIRAAPGAGAGVDSAR